MPASMALSGEYSNDLSAHGQSFCAQRMNGAFSGERVKRLPGAWRRPARVYLLAW